MKRETTLNWALLNRADYENTGIIKSLLMHLNDLLNCATRGDTVAHSVYIDLMGALENVATLKQGSYLQLWLDGYSQEEIAEKYQISQPTVNIRITQIAKKISNYLF
jgi:DNA-directed RNA polymerase specialized sigma24 family protein